VFELRADAESKQHYPFDFTLRIHYRLEQNSLHVQYVVQNEQEEALYFSIGAHPAFNCPLQPGEDLYTDYDLEFPGRQGLKVSSLNDGLRTGEERAITLHDSKVAVSTNLFANEALVLLNNQVNDVRLVSRKTEHGVLLRSSGWPSYGIWSKKDNDQFVCLEPWFGVTDSADAHGDLSVKYGIIHLGAKGSFACDYTMEFF
jgi:galactose mutarotase-like enzyme